MTDHEAIQELLAGYALRSLSGIDAEAADRALTEHVPGCASCRGTIEAFGAVAADLSLVVPDLEPPETLLPRMHRSMEPRGRRTGALASWGAGRAVAVAAGLVLVIGLGGLALTRGGSGNSQLTSFDLADALALAGRADAQTTSLGHATEVTVPGMTEFYIYGQQVPSPPPGSVYRLWLVAGSSTTYVGEFAPLPDGSVALRIKADPQAFDHALITVEPAGSEPSEPGEPAWQQAS